AKLDRMRANKTDPYPVRFDKNADAADLHTRFDALAAGEQTTTEVKVAGRLVGVRRQGGLSFADLADRTGTVQLFVDTARIGEPVHHAFDDLDLGDWVGVSGAVMKTRRGELSVALSDFELLGKALRPLPDPHSGLTDTETRYRQRYVDLAANDRSRQIFGIRRAAIRAIRDELADRGFWEVEGPVLQTIQGGAAARPFVTHHKALDIDLYLRIALELHLTRLVVGGLA
nr:amino acid--tRNA ligase-related protein [Micromonospora sp. DSM 115978]